MQTVSVILPTLDEADRIVRRLDELARNPEILEVLVVDGGSSDGTSERVRDHGSARVIDSRRGRGPQQNAGAAAARGDILLFQHADTQLPPDVVPWIRHVLSQPRTVAGAFHIRTVDETGRHPLAPLLRIADLRSRRTRLPYGDQALFVRRDAFEQVGGFPDQPLMEDLELGRRLSRIGRIGLARTEVLVSGRRFLASPVRTALLWNLLPALYRAGVSAERLERVYGVTR